VSEKETDHKLDTGLAPGEITKTCTPKFKLKFTDYAVDKFQANFLYTDKNGETKTKPRAYVPFDVSRHTILKGLRLFQNQKTKSKTFVLQYWYNGKSLPLTIGKFKLGIFGCRDCENEVFKIVRAHTNNKGYWIKDPKLTIRDQENRIQSSIVEESYKLIVNKVIERICKADFPKAKREGRLSASSISTHCLHLIGRNWRTRHLIYVEDYLGHGLVKFKPNYHKRTAKPVDWNDLFSKFPTGHGIIKDKKFNPNNELSVYDSDLGKETIDNLTPGLIKRYIENKDRGFGTKKNMLETFKTLWSFALDKGLLGDSPPKNPTRDIVFKKPEVARSPGSRYNDLRFSDQELKTIYKILIKLSEKYPFQAEALLFMLCTGRRAEETCKIRKSNINKDRTLITLPASITKARKVEYVDITPPVAFVLKQLDKHLAGTYQGYRFVDWLFPTTRINKQRLHEDKYVRSDSCRIKELRGCWNSVIKETGIVGVPKMLRKTFSSIAKLELGTTSKARVLTGHEQDATLDIHYDKSTEQQRKQYANQVSKLFDFEKASNE
jgi:integrase